MADSSKKQGTKHFWATAIVWSLMSSLAVAGDSAHDIASRLRADSVKSVDESTSSSREGFNRRALAYQPTTAEPGWFVERADNSSLRISVLSQTRYAYSQREAGFIPSGTEQTTGFALSRTRVALDGTIVSSQFNYRLSFDFGDAELSRGRGRGIAPFLAGSSGAPRLLDAYAQYNFAGKREGYYFKFGQFQSTILTEEAIASEYQLAVDRSMVSEFLGPGYTQGMALGRVKENFAWEVSVSDGGRYTGSRETDNTPYNSVSEADFAFGIRADVKLEGSWDQFSDFTSFQGSNPGTKFGGGLLYQFHGNTNPGGQTPGFVGQNAESTQAFTWTLDYQHEGDGWNFFAAYVGQWVDWEFSRATLGLMHNAFVFQGGYFMDDRTEVFGRFEVFWVDKLFRNGFGAPDGYIHRFATVGVNRYILPESHAAKLTFDASYAFDSTFAIALGGSDTLVLPDPAVTGFQGVAEHEFVLRAQLQIAF